MRLNRAAPILLFAAGALIAGGCSGGSSNASQPEGAAPPTARHSQYETGEKDIEGFGREAGGSRRTELLGALHGYLEAVASGNYRAACTHLSSIVLGSLRQLAKQVRASPGCPKMLGRLLLPSAAAVARRQATGRVIKVRVQGHTAFVVFHAPGARLYEMTLRREAGAWRVTTVTVPVLAPSSRIFSP